MARIIEFQGKAIANGEWVTGNLVLENNLYNQCEIQYDHCVYIERKLNSDIFKKCLIIPTTAGQFTNVLGCDGKKIYEHDIVSNEQCARRGLLELYLQRLARCCS